MKRTLAILGSATVALVLAIPASPRSTVALTIRHQVRGCHTWSVNSGPYTAAQSVTLHRGDTIVVINDDIMPHKLVQTAGPKLRLPVTANMNHMGAVTKVIFAKTGTYRFTTKFGEDYPSMSHMETVGEDYVLTLRVRVT